MARKSSKQAQNGPSLALEASFRLLREQGIRFAPIADLKPWADNPRVNAEAVPVVVASMQRFGWTNPVLVRQSDWTVEAGHTRLLAALHLGLTEVPIVELGHDEAEARAYTVADNRTAEFSAWSPQLATMMGEWGAEDFVGTGFADMDEVYRAAKMTIPAEPKANENADTSPAVLIECESEEHQAEVLKWVMEKGWSCRALM